MMILLTTLALSFGARANPFVNGLRELLRADPPLVTIAPCEDDYACVQVGKLKVMMDQVALKRDGYEIVGVAKPGQPGVLLIRAHHENVDQLILVIKDGGQIYAFNPAVDERERTPVPTEVVQRLHTPELKRLLEARTEDQVKLRADLLAQRVHPNNVILQMDLENLFHDGLVSQEIKGRLNVFSLAVLTKSAWGPSLSKAMRTELKVLQWKVLNDLRRCGFAQTCAPGV